MSPLGLNNETKRGRQTPYKTDTLTPSGSTELPLAVIRIGLGLID